MKNLLAIILTALMLSSAAVVEAGNTKEFDVNGLKVILRQTPKEVISARLFIKGGTANYTKKSEGVEALALSLAVNGGTKSKDKLAFNSAAEKIGTEFGSATSYDYGDMHMTCVRMFWDESWALFADAIMNPAFDETEFKLMREQMATNAKATESDPDSHLRNIAMTNAFGESNYGKISAGTEGSLNGLSLSDVTEHYRKIIGKENCFLVVVGNVEEADLRAKIEASLKGMGQGRVANKEKRILITETSHNVEHRDIATNYIRGLMSAPTMDSKDGVPMMVAMNILGDRYFEELRTKRSLSYAPAAFYSRGVINNPYNAIYISTTDPTQSMEVMVAEINKIKKEGFDEQELKDTKQTFLTYHYMGLETTSSQSNSIGMAELNGGWELAETFTNKVNALSLKDINRVFDIYTKAIAWTYLGKEEQVTPEAFKEPVPVAQPNKPY